MLLSTLFAEDFISSPSSAIYFSITTGFGNPPPPLNPDGTIPDVPDNSVPIDPEINTPEPSPDIPDIGGGEPEPTIEPEPEPAVEPDPTPDVPEPDPTPDPEPDPPEVDPGAGEPENPEDFD